MGKSERITVQAPKSSTDDGSRHPKADQPTKNERGAKKRGSVNETPIAKRVKLGDDDEFANIFLFISVIKPHILAQPGLPVLPFDSPPEVPRWVDVSSPTTKVGFAKRFTPTRTDGLVVCNAYMEVFMRARLNQKDCYDLVDAGGRAIKPGDVYLDPGARTRLQLLQLTQQLFDHYHTTLEREWNEFKRRMSEYRRQRRLWEHKLLKFMVENHPQCLVNEVTDEDLNELEMEFTKPDEQDVFYMGAMTYIHQVPAQHKEGNTASITKRITELQHAIKRIHELIEAETTFQNDEAWLGSDSEVEDETTVFPTIISSGFPRPTQPLLYHNWVVERYAHWITKAGRPKDPDRITKFGSTFEISTPDEIQTKDPADWGVGTISLSPHDRKTKVDDDFKRYPWGLPATKLFISTKDYPGFKSNTLYEPNFRTVLRLIEEWYFGAAADERSKLAEILLKDWPLTETIHKSIDDAIESLK